MAISANLNRVVGGLGLVVPIPRVVQQPVFFTIADTVMSESKPSSVGGLSQGAARHLRIVTCTLTWQYSRAFLAAVLVTPSHPPCPTDFVCRTREQMPG